MDGKNGSGPITFNPSIPTAIGTTTILVRGVHHALLTDGVWKGINISGIGCPLSGCTGNEALTLDLANDLAWRARSDQEELPYICMAKCITGYRWHRLLERCLKVDPSPK